jgi:hypothetical protein
VTQTSETNKTWYKALVLLSCEEEENSRRTREELHYRFLEILKDLDPFVDWEADQADFSKQG